MGRVCLYNGNVVLPGEVIGGAGLLIINDRIERVIDERVEAETVIDLGDGFVFPGFIDIHCHGNGGVDVNGADDKGLKCVCEYLASKGVTSWVPTLVPDEPERYAQTIESIGTLNSESGGLAGAQPLGVHYEGVFANRSKCGALRPQYFRGFSGTEDDDLPVPQGGVKLMTVAPEIQNGIPLVQKLADSGWIVAVGHTEADPRTLDSAVEAGASHVTHLFNAMSGIHHRERGVAGWCLTNTDVTCDLIADGAHVHPEILRLAIEAKSIERTLLISDSMPATGLGDGVFEVWGRRVEVRNGLAVDERGVISGSVISMLDAVNLCISMGFDHSEVARMSSTNPASLLRIDAERGSIEEGKRADITVLDREGDIKLTIIGGQIVWKRDRIL